MSKDWHELISQPQYETMLEEDVWVTMRDGVRLSVDVFRPKAEGKFPALISWPMGYGKDQLKLPTNPVWQASDYVRGTGGHECGEQWYFVPRGYAQVIPDPRGVGKSEGESNMAATGKDGYDLVEWIAEQPWCNGNVGMIGMSAYAVAQYPIAAEQPPHLKAIMPFEGNTGQYQQHGGFFNASKGFSGAYFGHGFWLSAGRIQSVPRPASFDEFSEEELKEKIKELQNDPDIMCTPYLYLITLAPERNPVVLDRMLHPCNGPFYSSAANYTKLRT